jgi:hypothetical protein
MSKRKNKTDSTLEFIVTVIIIALIILTLGWFAQKWQFETENNDDDSESNNLEKKKKKLILIEKRISDLQLHKDQIEKDEKRVFISARILVGLLLVGINILYYKIYNNPFKLDSQLNFNEVTLLAYSFSAFVTYGTPSNLVEVLKSKAGYFLKKRHIDVYIELEQLVKERKLLELEVIELTKLCQIEP